MVSNRQRVARMRRLAVRALDAYPFVDRELRFIADEENITFRVDATATDGRGRFLLRVHRPARHGRNVDSAVAVGSKLAWLMALRAGTDLLVPAPFRTIDGEVTTVAVSPDVPEPRVCSVLRWMDGRVHSAAPRPVHLRRLGSVMARLHNHAGQWRVPPGFVRIRWNWELRYRNDYEDFRSALIDGYTRHRPLPPGGLAHLDDFIATREVAFGLWFTGTAQVNPVFRAELDQMQADIGRSLDTLRA
jgi:Ser/Thr protein kinase RdoA (MazF antagonist)